MLVIHQPQKTRVLTLDSTRPFPVVVATPTDAINLPYAIPTISALRAAPIPGTAEVIRRVLGYYAPGDVDLPDYRWSPTATLADNGGTVIKPDAIAAGSPGRWLAIWTGDVNLKWFGAKGDSETDDTAAISAALSVAGAKRAYLYVPDGNYKTTGGHVDVPTFQGIKGDGMERSNFTHTGNNVFFTSLTHNLFDPLRLEGFSINCFERQFNDNSGANAMGLLIGNSGFITLSHVEVEGYVGTAGRGITFRNSREWTEDLYVENVHVRRCTNCIVFDVVAPGTTSFCATRFIGVVFALATNQRGLWAKDGAYLYGSSLQIKGNCEGANSVGLHFDGAACPQSFFDIMFEGALNSETVIKLTNQSRVLGHGRITGWETGDGNFTNITTNPKWAQVEPGSTLSCDSYRGTTRIGPTLDKLFIGRLAADNSPAFTKIVVEAFAGRADNTHLGLVRYTLASIGGIRGTRTMVGGHFNGIDVRVYLAGNGEFDVVAVFNVVDYPWLNFRAWRYDLYGCSELYCGSIYDSTGKTQVDFAYTNLDLIDINQRVQHGTAHYWGDDVYNGSSHGVGLNHVNGTGPASTSYLDARATNGLIVRHNGAECIRFYDNGRTSLRSLPVYADNTGAAAAGLQPGDLYRTAAGDLKARV